MLNLYELIPSNEGFQFINQSGDQYNVYLTTYSLLDPDSSGSENYIEVYMIGFSCKRANPLRQAKFDPRTKATILAVFNSFFKQYPDDAFVYICDNNDGRARNRRVTFGKWFNENNTIYEQYHLHIRYLENDWFSSLIFRKGNNYGKIFIDAYYFTVKQLIGSE